MKGKLALALQWGIALGLLYWALRDLSWPTLAAVLRRLSPPALVGLFLLNVLIIVLLALRWWWVMRSLGLRVNFRTVLIYRWAAFGFNYFTPGPQVGGEPLKVFWLVRRHGIPVETALATVALDKGYELVSSMAVLMFGLVVSAAVLGNRPWKLGLGVLLPALLGVGYPWLLTRDRRPLRSLVARFFWEKENNGPAPASACGWRCRMVRGLQTVVRMEQAMAGFYTRHRGVAWGLYGLSAFIWLLMLWEYYWTWHLLGTNLNWPQAITALTAARLTILSPLPGDTGILEAGQRWVASALGVPAVQGVAMAVVIRVRDVLFAGLGFAWGLHLTWRSQKATPGEENPSSVPALFPRSSSQKRRPL